MSLLLIGNIVSEHGDVNPTTESDAVCLKRVAEAQFFVPRSQRGSSGATNSSKHLNMRWVLNAEIVVVILFFVVYCVCLGYILIVFHIM